MLKATGLGGEYAAGEDSSARADDFAPLAADGPRRTSVTGELASDLRPSQQPVSPPGTEVTDADAALGAGRRSLARLLGVLVHRAVQAGIAGEVGDHRSRRRRVAALLRSHERAGVADLNALLDAVIAAIDSLVAHPDLAARLRSPHTRVHEVPFSVRRSDGMIVRGVIDALIEYPDGRLEILEFKTGERHPDHEAQLAMYLAAARALFPGATIDARLVYADGQLSRQAGV